MLNKSKIVATIQSVVASPAIGEYKHGITANPTQRRKSYFNVGFEHFVVLEADLNAEQALKLEEDLFQALTKDPAVRRTVLYRKYDNISRDKAHTPMSLGGKVVGSGGTYSLYIVWWNKHHE